MNTPPTSDAIAMAFREYQSKWPGDADTGMAGWIERRAREIAAQPGEGAFSSVHETDGQAVIRWVAQGQIFGRPSADDARRYIAELEPHCVSGTSPDITKIMAHGVFVYEIDYGPDDKWRGVRLEDFNKVVAKLTSPPHAADALDGEFKRHPEAVAERIGDMGEGTKLQLFREDDGDFIVSVMPEKHRIPDLQVQFCVPGRGGGSSRKTWDALCALHYAMHEDAAIAAQADAGDAK